MTEIKIELPATKKFIGFAVRFVKECAKLFEFGHDVISAMELAAEEGLLQVIDQSYTVENTPMVTVTCKSSAVGFEVSIRDHGIPYDEFKHEVYDPDRVTFDSDIQSLGLHLMEKSVDEVRRSILGRSGKEIVLIKHRRAELIFNPEDEAPAKDVVRQLFRKRRRQEISFRPFRNEDAVGVARCAYMMHGYHFYDDDIYRPEILSRLVSDGVMFGQVAEADDGEIAAFCALKRHERGGHTAELTYVLLNPRIRAPGSAEGVIESLIASQSDWLKLVYSYVFANHALSQDLASRVGLTPVGVLLNVDDPTLRFNFRNTHSDMPLESPISNILYTRLLSQTDNKPIHLPLHHKAMIEKLYRRHGIDPIIIDICQSSDNPSMLDQTKIETRISNKTMVAWITVASIGCDFSERVMAFIVLCRRAGVRFIELRLPLTLPEAVQATSILETHGFLFGGLFLNSNYGDCLVLQWPMNRTLDPDQIKVLPAEREILDYILMIRSSHGDTIQKSPVIALSQNYQK